ncbi:MAG: T9SS type A sorting domain-containing protein [Sphingobacteriales bacterium]|nr:MAG: T9SS type A sorting domain-containing protein [Sphingobacteriales bacterium]
MRKPYLLLLMLVVAFSASAQTRTRLSTSLSYFFFDIDGVDIRNDSSVYTYTQGRGGEPGHAINADTALGFTAGGYYSYVLAKWFDADDRVTYAQGGFYAASQWYSSSGNRYTYNTAGQILTDTTYAYSLSPISLNKEFYSRLQVNTYSTTGQLAETYLLKPTINPSHPWDTAEHELYHYNNTGLLLVKQTDTLLPTGFVTSDSTIFSYDGAGLCTHSISKRLVNGNWANDVAHAYTYTPHGDVFTQYDISYRPAIADTTDIRVTYYNAAFLPEGVVHSTSYYNTLLTVDSIGMVYNSNNQVDTFVQYFRSNNTWSHEVSHAISGKYFYEVYTPSAVSTTAAAQVQLQLYPVPAGNSLYLRLSEKEQQQYTLRITDMQGRQAMQQTYTGNTVQTINTSNLPAGVYNLTLFNIKGGVQHSKFTIAR